MLRKKLPSRGGEKHGRAKPVQGELFREITQVPVIVAWGLAVDSTAMLIELVESGSAPDIASLPTPGVRTRRPIESFQSSVPG
jgi:hypothetical protein